MIETNRTTKVEILGKEYSLVGDEEGYLLKIADSVDKQLRNLQEETKLPLSGRLEILGCLNIADQLQKIKNAHNDLINQISDTINNLITEIDTFLQKK